METGANLAFKLSVLRKTLGRLEMLKNAAEEIYKRNWAIDSRQFNNTHAHFPLVEPKI
jgi:hypothetical protein